jgi:serine/threonine protein kinase
MEPLRGEELEAGVRVGDFRIERRIGAGGMGVVYRAHQVSLGRVVALKILGSALNRDPDVARFQREAQAVAKLNHPGIAAVHFVGQDRQFCYLVMELIDGLTLRQAIDYLAHSGAPGQTLDTALQQVTIGGVAAREMRFDNPTETHHPGSEGVGHGSAGSDADLIASRVISSRAHVHRCGEVVRDVARALAHAHEQGVVHRDIKPENILLDRLGKVYLIDFGLARFFEDVTLTAAGSLIGTPMYMSPEQVTGRIRIDHRSDIYSLGLVLYELLTLRRPISAAGREELLRHIVSKEIEPASWRNGGIPRDLESVVHKAASKDAESRYVTASDFADDIQRFLDGKPVSARPYRYRLDHRQIIAERPASAAFLGYMAIALTSMHAAVQPFVLAEAIRLRMDRMEWAEIMLWLVGLLFIPLGYMVSISILSGRRNLLIPSTLMLLGSVGFTSTLLAFQSFLGLKPLPVVLATAGLPTLILFVGLLVITLRAPRAWLRLANALRSEHG